MAQRRRLSIPTQKDKYAELNKRLFTYAHLVQGVYDNLNLEAANIASRLNHDDDKPFQWKDYPQTKQAIEDLKAKFIGNMKGIIMRGNATEWKNSNLVQDLLADGALKYYGARKGDQKYKVYYQPNNDALKAFQQRTSNGFNLSTNLWTQSENYTKELEYAISSAIEKGTSAVTLSKRISKYLLDFPKLKDDYKERYGSAVECHDCEYRSIRLARSEINMAYRTAEQKRWEQMDFVVGYEIKLSKAHDSVHHHDICDQLAGKYPKDFKWTGWHPNDMCYCVPILKTLEEFESLEDNGSENAVTDVPDSFKQWIGANEQRINEAKKNGTLPYFVKDNIDMVDDIRKDYNQARHAVIASANHGSTFVMNDETKGLLEERGFFTKELASINDDKYNSSAISGFDLLKFDEELSSLFERYGIEIDSRLLQQTNTTAELIYKFNKDGEKGELRRVFFYNTTTGEKCVNHSRFVLPKTCQKKGISKEVFKYQLEQYENIGIDRIYVTANKEVGSYCWAKYGFMANKNEIEFIVENKFKEGLITEKDYNNVLNILRKRNGEIIEMDRIAALPNSFNILKDGTWYGEMNLNNIRQKEILKDYIGVKRSELKAASSIYEMSEIERNEFDAYVWNPLEETWKKRVSYIRKAGRKFNLDISSFESELADAIDANDAINAIIHAEENIPKLEYFERTLYRQSNRTQEHVDSIIAKARAHTQYSNYLNAIEESRGVYLEYESLAGEERWYKNMFMLDENKSFNIHNACTVTPDYFYEKWEDFLERTVKGMTPYDDESMAVKSRFEKALLSVRKTKADYIAWKNIAINGMPYTNDEAASIVRAIMPESVIVDFSKIGTRKPTMCKMQQTVLAMGRSANRHLTKIPSLVEKVEFIGDSESHFYRVAERYAQWFVDETELLIKTYPNKIERKKAILELMHDPKRAGELRKEMKSYVDSADRAYKRYEKKGDIKSAFDKMMQRNTLQMKLSNIDAILRFQKTASESYYYGSQKVYAFAAKDDWKISTLVWHKDANGVIDVNAGLDKVAMKKYEPHVKGVVVNDRFGNDPKWTTSINNDVLSGYHPKDCNTIEGIFDHEFGHSTDFFLSFSKSEEYKSIIRGKSIGIELSGYAVTDDYETVAEAWCEFLNSPHPRKLAIEIGKEIEKQLKVKFRQDL